MLGWQSSQRPEKESSLDANGKTNGKSRLNTGQGHPKETVEQASRAVNLDFPKDSVLVSQEDFRKNFKVRVSGDLAKRLWHLLEIVVVVHLLATVAFSWQLINRPDTNDTEEDRTTRIETAISTVSDTAKTLYAVLGVLTTAVTGYYFTTGADSASSDHEGDRND